MIIIKDSNEIIGAIQATADILVVKDKNGYFSVTKNRFGMPGGGKFRNLTDVGTFLQQETNKTAYKEEKASILFRNNNLEDAIKKILSI